MLLYQDKKIRESNPVVSGGQVVTFEVAECRADLESLPAPWLTAGVGVESLPLRALLSELDLMLLQKSNVLSPLCDWRVIYCVIRPFGFRK